MRMLSKIAYNNDTKKLEVEFDLSSFNVNDDSIYLTKSEDIKTFLRTQMNGDEFVDKAIEVLIDIS